MTGQGHRHDHGHDHGEENPWAGQGAVLLDIGGDVGALVVEMPAAMTGVEVEIRPIGSPVDRGAGHPHVAVVARPVASGVVPSLVYPALVEGSYELYEKGTGDVELTAEVVGGEVTETVWPRGVTPAGAVGAPSGGRAAAG
jgi:hypothetical protein